MDCRHVAFVITACLLMILSGVFGKTRVFSESTNLTNRPRPKGCRQTYYCENDCFLHGKAGHCAEGLLRCYCKFYDEEKGSKFLQLAKEMSMEKIREATEDNLEQRDGEQYP